MASEAILNQKKAEVKELAEKIYEFVTDTTLLNSQAVRNWNEAKNYHDKILSQRRMAFYQHVINRVK